MLKKTKYAVPFLVVVGLLVSMHSAAYCLSGLDFERYFGIHDGHVYVLSANACPIKKIEKNSGNIKWEAGPWYIDDSYNLGGNYTPPVFAGGNFYTIVDKFRLLGFDCNTGRVTFDYVHDAVSIPVFPELGQIIYGDLALVIAFPGIQAIDMKKKTKKWEFTFRQDAVVHVYSYFQIEDSLFIFADVPVEGAASYKAESDKNFRKGALIELNCSTGEVVNHYDGRLFWDDPKVSLGWGRRLGDWRGKPLLYISGYLNEDDYQSSLFTFDPESGSAKMVIEQLTDVDPTREVGPGPSPFLWRDMVLYSLTGEDYENITLVGRGLADGKIHWTSSSRAQKASGEWGRLEAPYTAGKGKLFSVELDFSKVEIPDTTGKGKRFRDGYDPVKDTSVNVVCRTAATGEICWRSKNAVLEDLSLFGVEMQVSEGSLFMQTEDYMRAFDVKDGKLLWQVRLGTCQKRAPEQAIDESKEPSSQGVLAK